MTYRHECMYVGTHVCTRSTRYLYFKKKKKITTSIIEMKDILGDLRDSKPSLSKYGRLVGDLERCSNPAKSNDSKYSTVSLIGSTQTFLSFLVFPLSLNIEYNL